MNRKFFKRLPALLLIVLPLLSCGRIDLLAFSSGIPLQEELGWGGFEIVIELGSEGTWDTVRVGDCSVILDDAMYKIWYSGSDGTGYRLIYAESNDGKSWSSFQQTVDRGNIPGVDDASIRFPVVLKLGQMYKMWYSGSPGGGGMSIIYCDSWDGVSWSNFEVVLEAGQVGEPDGGMVWSPAVILDEGKYKMWYSGTNTGQTADRIIYCESIDGKDWDEFVIALDIGNVPGFDDLACNSPTVLKDGGLYKMWYSGQVIDGSDFNVSTIYCESADGITWENFQVVIQAGAEGTADTNFITGPVVINNNGKGLMWYRGVDDSNVGSIVYCQTE